MEPGLKKTILHAALFAMPISLYGLGLGEMTVKSSLDQPFVAEIELIDATSALVPGIRASIAEPQNFHQIGMQISPALSLLRFKIEPNKRGKYVIKVHSVTRMTEPYIELVVDLTWPKGQLYKAYTILLDPPGYQLDNMSVQNSAAHYKKVNAYQNQPGVINKTVLTQVAHNPVGLNDAKKRATYGPTITNESVWQIAQRYKTSDIILPQVVLAIVGANPDAFVDGNLNGLKVGVRLIIPPTAEILKVPADLATEEVMAHDKAWNDKKAINHILTPPYINMSSQTGNASQSVLDSKVPSIPKLTSSATPLQNPSTQMIMANPTVSMIPIINKQVVNQVTQNRELDEKTKTELAITTAAVESVRESNALLMEQLHLLQKQNKVLQQQVTKRDKELEIVRTQMTVMMKERLAIAAQTNSSDLKKNDSNGYWLWFLLLFTGAGGGGLAYWYFTIREQKPKSAPDLSDTAIEAKPFIPQVIQESHTAEPETQIIEPILPTSNMSIDKDHVTTAEKEQSDQVIDPLEPVSVQHDVIHKERADKTKSTENSTENETAILDDKTDNEANNIEEKYTYNNKEVPEQEALEFESGLHELIREQPAAVPEKNIEDDDSVDKSLDFVSQYDKGNDVAIQSSAALGEQSLNLSELENTNQETANPLKNVKALDTLLDLAKTYMGMGDFESARHCLEEVNGYGSEAQKEAAQCLLDEIKDK